MNTPTNKEEYYTLIQFFRNNLLRKIIFTLILSLCLALLYIILFSGTTMNFILVTVLFILCLMPSVAYEFKSYMLIKRKQYTLFKGICIKKDINMPLKNSSCQFYYSLDIRGNFTAKTITQLKVPLFIYNKLEVGSSCTVICIHAHDCKRLYVYPSNTSNKRGDCSGNLL